MNIMSNIYDKANQLERELREAEQYKELAKAYEKIRTNEEANEDITAYQTQQKTGEEISEEEVLQAQNISGKMTENELTIELMNKERALNQVLNDINGIIMKPVQDIYQG